MSRVLSTRGIATVVALVLAWCALWRDVSVANVASGIVVATVSVVLLGGDTGSGTVRVGPLLRFASLVAIDLVRSTANVVYEILTRADHTEEAIIAVDTGVEAMDHLLLLVVAITVTPGTAVVDTDRSAGRLYLHVLHARNAPQIVEHVTRLADLACSALPTTPTRSPVEVRG